MIITGIGSRKTPQHVCALMTQLGAEAQKYGWFVRSGHADGADYAFECGAQEKCIVYLPWMAFNDKLPLVGLPSCPPLRQKVLDIVFEHEPYAKDLSEAVQKIKARNVYQVLGANINKPANVVVCWTPGGDIVGGTGLALKIADAHNIPIINLGEAWARPNEEFCVHLDELIDMIKEKANGQ